MFNPANWRIHPKAQQDALEGVLSEVGWVQDVIVNKRTGNLIDGHLRCQVAARNEEQTIPVVYVDLSEDEEAIILASLDPLAAMAATDKAKLEELLQVVHSDDARVQQMMADMGEAQGIVPTSADKWADAMGALPDEDRAPFQQMTFTLHDDQVAVVKDAIKKANSAGNFKDSPNANGNGNALTAICEAFLNG